MKLSETIAVWELLHLKDTGEVGFCDLADAIKQIVGLSERKMAIQTILPRKDKTNKLARGN